MSRERVQTPASVTKEALRAAFPRSIGPAVEEALSVLPAPKKPDLDFMARLRPVGPLFIDGEEVTIPYRIYSLKPPLLGRFRIEGEPALVLACAYTRHHDGFVRERAVRRVVEEDRPWVVPFIVQLLGEYVVEIAVLIRRSLDKRSPTTFLRFAEENDAFLRLTRQRIVSYWNRYYRGDYPLGEYPPVVVMTRLGLWGRAEGQRPSG